MPVSFSKYVAIPSSSLVDAGVFDPILDRDSRLFLDPHLLKHTDVPEFAHCYDKLQAKFLGIKKLLDRSQAENDLPWKAAVLQMKWSEVEGLCIGYSSKGTSGRGIGAQLGVRLLRTAKEIIAHGHSDPELFELIGLFEDGFGADRISDMTANVIRDELRLYTKRIFSELQIRTPSKGRISGTSGLLINPFNDHEICLVPRTLLRHLPLAMDWDATERILYTNEDVRSTLNDLIGATWKQATNSLTKAQFKGYVLKYPELFESLITAYSKKHAEPYNFADDPMGQVLWYSESQRATLAHPLKLSLSKHPSMDEVEKLVLTICKKFTELVENNGLSKLLYNTDDTPKSEEAAQLLFFGVCESYCEANGIMIARESDSGRGPVDFKFGSNQQNSVLVEIKKSTNTSGLTRGVTKQLPEYQKSEKSKRAIYLVIDVGNTKAGIARLNKLSKDVNGSAIKILRVNGLKKSSASKL